MKHQSLPDAPHGLGLKAADTAASAQRSNQLLPAETDRCASDVKLSVRDELLRKATRLYNELARIRKEAQRAPRCERPPLEARAAEIGEELRVIMDAHRQAIA